MPLTWPGETCSPINLFSEDASLHTPFQTSARSKKPPEYATVAVSEWPTFFAFVTSFIAELIMWMNQQTLEQAGGSVRDRVMEAEDERRDGEAEDTVTESLQTVRLSLPRTLHAQLRRLIKFGPVERSIR